MTWFTEDAQEERERKVRATKRVAADLKIEDDLTPKVEKVMTTPVLSFIDDKKVNGDSNGRFPLVINENIHGHLVGGCLMDEGNPLDILYQNTFEYLRLKRENLKYCFGLEAIGLNGTNARP